MRIILVTWKGSNSLEVFSSLKSFTDMYPSYRYNTMQNYLSRKNEPYENDIVKVERLNVIKS